MMAFDQLPAAVRGTALIAFAAALWSTTGVVSRVLFDHTDVSPFAVAFARLALAAPAFIGIGMAAMGRGFFRLPAGTGRWMIALGLAQAGFQGGYLAGVKLIGAGLATLVTLCLAPILVALLAALLLGERLTPRVLVALPTAILGTAMLVVSPQALALGDGLWLGLAAAMGAALVYAAFTLIGRYAAARVHPMQTAGFGFGAGALALLPLALATGPGAVVDGAALAVPVMLYVALVPTTLGYLCFFHGLRHTTATASSILVLLEPLGAALLAWALLDEALGPFGLLGALLLTGAVYLITVPGRPSAPG